MKRLSLLIAFAIAGIFVEAQAPKKIIQLPVNSVVHDTDLMFIGHPTDGRLYQQTMGTLFSKIIDTVNTLGFVTEIDVSPWTRGILPSASATESIIYPTTQTDSVFIGLSSSGLTGNKPKALFEVNGTADITGPTNIEANITNGGLLTQWSSGNLALAFASLSSAIVLNIGSASQNSIQSNFTAGVNGTAYNAQLFRVGATETTAAGGYTVVNASISNNSDSSSTQTSALYRAFYGLVQTKSNSTTPVTVGVNFEAGGLGAVNSRTQTFTTAYSFKSDGMSSSAILTAGGNFYSFFADSSAASTFTGASAWGYVQIANSANTINNNIQGAVLFGFTTAGTIASPDASALVELRSTTKGLLLMRMTKAQRDAIPSPTGGLEIYQTDNTPGLRVYNGSNWMSFTETAD